MAGAYIKIENVLLYNSNLHDEIMAVTGCYFMTKELMIIVIKRQLESYSIRKCDANKKRFFEACLNKL